jgi:hypothetical protein
MFIQLVERSRVEDVRAGFRAIEDKQANAIVPDLAPDHWTCSNCRHYPNFGTFPLNAKRRRKVKKLQSKKVKMFSIAALLTL